MKLASWILILSILNFGIGWMTATIAGDGSEQVVEASPGSSPVSSPGSLEKDPRGTRFHGGWRSRGHGHSPVVDVVRHLADELGLDEAARSGLSALVEEVRVEVEALEQQIFEVTRGTEKRVMALLSTEQMAKLQELRSRRMQDYFEGRRDSARSFFADELQLAADEVEACLAALQANDSASIEYFNRCDQKEPGRGGWNHEEFRSRMAEISEQRRFALSELLNDEQLESYLDRFSRFGPHRGMDAGKDDRRGPPRGFHTERPDGAGRGDDRNSDEKHRDRSREGDHR